MKAKVHARRRAALLALLFLVPISLGYAQSASPESATVTTTPSTPFDWPTFDEAVAAAEKSGKPILVDIYAPWCSWCRKMQIEVYGDKDMQAYVQEHFEFGRLNIADSETTHAFKAYTLTSQQLGYALGAEGTPTTVFLDSSGDYITRLNGYWNLESFGKAAHYIGSKAYREKTYNEFIQATDASN